MKKIEKAVKKMLIDHSVPDAERIKSKFEFNTDDGSECVRVEVITAAKKRNIIIIVCACLLLITSICIAVPYLYNHSSSTVVFGIQYFDGSHADWQVDMNIQDFASENGVYTFNNFTETAQYIDVNNPDALRIDYESNDGDAAVMNVYLNNKLSEEFRYCVNLKKFKIWNSLTVKYETKSIADGYTHTLFFQDKSRDNNYVIRIKASKNKGVDYYINELALRS